MMANSRLNQKDISSWVQSVVEYVRDAPAKFLVLNTEENWYIFKARPDIRPIFDALVDSEVITVDLGDITHCEPRMKDQVRALIGILSKTKIERLLLRGWLTVDDALSLMSVLGETRITHLYIGSNGIKFDRLQIDKVVSHVIDSHLTALSFYGNILSFETASVFSQGLCSTKITWLNLGGTFKSDVNNVPGEKRPEPWHPLVSNLHRTNITDLYLSNNNLGDSFMKELGAVLQNSKLQKLSLGVNDISDSGVEFLVPGLIRSKITSLDLTSNRINGDNSLGHCLKNTKILDLDLSYNPITHEKIFANGDFLQGSAVDALTFGPNLGTSPIRFPMEAIAGSELTYLNLSSSRLNLEQVSALASALRQSKLTQISLHNTILSTECYFVLGDCLKSSKLKFIDLSSTTHITLNDQYKPELKGGLDGIPLFLEETRGSSVGGVNLCFNHLKSKFEFIAPKLAGTTFILLNIERNFIGSSIVSLAAQLKFTAITELHLSDNDIKDHGAVVLADCLEESQIVILILRHNSITDFGAKSLGKVLRKTKLRYLDLKQNKIQDDGVVFLAERASGTCITYLDVEHKKENSLKRKLLIDRVVRDNCKKMQQFAGILNRAAIFTGDSNIFEFDRAFNDIDIEVFIDDCLQLYQIVSENPMIAETIEQDKSISDLKALKRFNDYSTDHPCFNIHAIAVFTRDCQLIYEKVMTESCLVQNTMKENMGVSPFHKRILSLLLEKFPGKFASFIGRSIEADVSQHVTILRRIEELGLTKVVEKLLLNRPLYMIDKSREFLHPYVYILLHKYKQPICSVEMEPDKIDKITEYFSEHSDVDGASELVNLLSSVKLS